MMKDMKRGFTLIELLVTISILGVLAVVGLSSFMGAQSKARDAQRKSEINAISKALDLYYSDFGQYPPGDVSSGKIIGCGDDGDPPAAHIACEWGATFAVGDTAYMVELPKDPKGDYFYAANAAGTVYYLYARLENTSDPAVPEDPDQAGVGGAYKTINAGGGMIFTPVCRSSGLAKCNYAVTSSNTRLDDSFVGADN
jgi:general secretion pathway protein G